MMRSLLLALLAFLSGCELLAGRPQCTSDEDCVGPPDYRCRAGNYCSSEGDLLPPAGTGSSSLDASKSSSGNTDPSSSHSSGASSSASTMRSSSAAPASSLASSGQTSSSAAASGSSSVPTSGTSGMASGSSSAAASGTSTASSNGTGSSSLGGMSSSMATASSSLVASSSSLMCSAGFLACGSQCVDSAAPETCGDCSNDCTALGGDVQQWGCSAGACTVLLCMPNFNNLNGTVDDGCESNSLTDVHACGATRVDCTQLSGQMGATCMNGTCVFSCVAAGDTACPLAGCKNIFTDPNNCGECGKVCPFGCSSRRCQAESVTAPSGAKAILTDGLHLYTAGDDTLVSRLGLPDAGGVWETFSPPVAVVPAGVVRRLHTVGGFAIAMSHSTAGMVRLDKAGVPDGGVAPLFAGDALDGLIGDDFGDYRASWALMRNNAVQTTLSGNVTVPVADRVLGNCEHMAINADDVCVSCADTPGYSVHCGGKHGASLDRTLAAMEESIVQVEMDATHVWWVTSAGMNSAIRRTALDGAGGVETVFSTLVFGTPVVMVMDETTVWFVENAIVRKFPKANPGTVTVLGESPGGVDDVVDMTLDATHVYWLLGEGFIARFER